MLGEASARRTTSMRPRNLSTDVSLLQQRQSVCKKYSGKIVSWWPVGIFNSEMAGEFDIKCDVPCVRPPSSEDCATRADAIVHHLPTYSTYHLPVQGKINFGLSLESTTNFPSQSPDVLKDKGYYPATTRPESLVQSLYWHAYDWESLISRGFANSSDWNSREKAVAFVARHCSSDRASLVERLAVELKKHSIEVHSLGTCAPSGTVDVHEPWMLSASKVDLLQDYKFYLAFENTFGEDGYVTEKVFDGFRAGCINIYAGAPDVSKHVPPDSLLIIPQEASNVELEAVAKKVHALTTNATAQENMMYWRSTPMSSWDEGAWEKQWSGGWQYDDECRRCMAACALSSNPLCEGKRFDSSTQSLVDI